MLALRSRVKMSWGLLKAPGHGTIVFVQPGFDTQEPPEAEGSSDWHSQLERICRLYAAFKTPPLPRTNLEEVVNRP